jgi:hypothetical protein
MASRLRRPRFRVWISPCIMGLGLDGFCPAAADRAE